MTDRRKLIPADSDLLFRQIQDENHCDYAECVDYSDANCECMAELRRRASPPPQDDPLEG